ncbi:repressor LexA [Paraclostridium bifermentans]|uniref:transcriptional repressor LexA n=1 Tax=Paraclostridium bifermentans TaxID=1490 RepID=UPI000A16D3D2|nr:transcriptional repressor LexA [Paraclostridium bifermentans]OSB07993.1 repressor LexA [Paraclostridium bifermentans]
MLELSKNQTKILEAIKWKINKFGYPPSVREICAAVDLRSTSTVHFHMNKLEELGYIKRDPTKPRAIEVLKYDTDLWIPGLNQEIIELPVIEFLKHKIRLKENIVENIKLPANFVIGTDNFIFKLNDNNLIEVGVLKDDYIIVDRCNIVKNGSVIIGIINDNKVILGRYFKNEEDIEIKFQDGSNDTVLLNKNRFKLIGKIRGNFRIIK